MLVSENPTPSLSEFQLLMKNTDGFLNRDAAERPTYYAKRGGNPLEDDVKKALDACAKGTAFEGTIIKVSGQKFPDIVADKLYGVEVKSTKDDHWTSTGSSILETTRVDGIERIYMTFGKLGGTPMFLSKPYEECLYGIAVTHMPRYLINMKLKPGETIFEKMGVPYDKLRQMDNPIAPVAKFYRDQLKPGESLWWTGDSSDETVSATIRLWKKLTPEEKHFYSAYGCVNYPEIFAGDYDRYSLWLTSQGVVDSHIRDQFSSGGQEEMLLSSGEKIKFPAVYRRVKAYHDLIVRRFSAADPAEFHIEQVSSDQDRLKHRLLAWADLVSHRSTMRYDLSMDALKVSFNLNDSDNSEKFYGNEKIVRCKYCGKQYAQSRQKQVEGGRFQEDDECPYCHRSNGTSLEWEFYNRVIE